MLQNHFRNLNLSKLDSILEKLDSVCLDDVSGIKLMNRIDQKFWFPASKLECLLEQLIPFYDVLEIKGKRMIGYQTMYFDTSDNQMYLHHHNGFRDRYKVRRRKYETSEYGFFEIKRKTNKQRTIKKRIETSYQKEAVTEAEYRFLNANSPYTHLNPQPVLFNRFNRISLINKHKSERCTIDVQLRVSNSKEELALENLAIIELKQGSILNSSPLVALLKKLQIQQKGLSKYCTGRALLEPGLKSNCFKERLLFLNKNIINNQLLCITC